MRDYAYLECYVGNSYKFYEATLNDDRSIDVTYGRIGTSGSCHHYDPNEKEFWKLIKEKESKGYKLLRTSPNGAKPNGKPREGMGYMIAPTQIKNRIESAIIATVEAYSGTIISQAEAGKAVLDKKYPIFTYEIGNNEAVIADASTGDLHIYVFDGNYHKLATESLINKDSEFNFYLNELNRFIEDKRKANAQTLQAVFA